MPSTKMPTSICSTCMSHVTKGTVNVLIKDDGKPFNPILKDVSFNEDGDGLGLALVNTIADIKYKFMYNQNVVFLTFKRQEIS